MKITTNTRLITHKRLCEILGYDTYTLHRIKDENSLLDPYWIQEESKSEKKAGRIKWDSSKLNEISAILHKVNAA